MLTALSRAGRLLARLRAIGARCGCAGCVRAWLACLNDAASTVGPVGASCGHCNFMNGKEGRRVTRRVQTIFRFSRLISAPRRRDVFASFAVAKKLNYLNF
jgi:hypothetical protein